jgi:CBS domain-containing protein
MRDNNIRHLPIVDEDNVLKGVLSMRDIIRILLADSKNKIRDLNDYIMGKYPA